jgi:hypothetical protein
LNGFLVLYGKFINKFLLSGLFPVIAQRGYIGGNSSSGGQLFSQEAPACLSRSLIIEINGREKVLQK